MSQLPPEYLDPQTPPDAVVTDWVRTRYAAPTMGVAVAAATDALAAEVLDAGAVPRASSIVLAAFLAAALTQLSGSGGTGAAARPR